MKVYVPVWFGIKRYSSVKEGSKHFFQLINKSRFLPSRYRTVVDKVLQHNSYFAHSENILLAMLHDDSPAIRELAARRILKVRDQGETSSIRTFQLPKLIFDAPTYYSMINWQECQLQEPPITRKFSNQFIEDTIIAKKDLLPLTNLVNHTQAVERIIKMVTDASNVVVGQEARDGAIRARLEGRKMLPKFESKKDFNIIEH